MWHASPAACMPCSRSTRLGLEAGLSVGSGGTLSYKYTLYNSIREVDPADWVAAGAMGLMMDPRFIEVVEDTMRDGLRVWHAVFHEGDTPVGCASFGLYRADIALLADAAVSRFVNQARRFVSNFAFVNVLFCGLPVSIGQRNLGFTDECDKSRLTASLDALMSRLAQNHGASLIVAKEFTEEQCEALDGLMNYGYLSAATPNLYVMDRRHRSFSDYCSSLKSGYRSEIKRSQKKFLEAGFQVERVQSGKLVAQTYSDELHGLYENVVRSADHKLELLPANFFRSLALAFPDDVSLTLVRDRNHTGAFMYSIRFNGCYYYMFCGIDYAVNREGDLYFNLFYEEMENWFEDDLPHVHMGQTSDEFKSRLGCTAIPLFCYVKARGLLRPIVNASINSLFPPPKPWQPRNIYKKT